MLTEPCLCNAIDYRLVYVGKKVYWQRSWPQLTHDIEIWECRHCGLKRTSPIPYLDERQSALYQKGEQNRLLLVGYDDGTSLSHNERITVRSCQNLIKRLPIQPGAGQLLDIGCGAGFLVREAIADGWQATGIDLDMKRIQLGKERGIPNLFTGDIASMNFPDCTFAVVTMHHVLEHVADPKSFLKQVWRVLRPGGILSFEVPNFDSWTGWVLRNNTRFPWVHLSPLEHIWQMTPQGVMSIFAAVSEYFLLETLSCRSNLEHGKSGFKSKVMRAMLAPNAWFGKGDRLIGIARKLEH